MPERDAASVRVLARRPPMAGPPLWLALGVNRYCMSLATTGLQASCTCTGDNRGAGC